MFHFRENMYIFVHGISKVHKANGALGKFKRQFLTQDNTLPLPLSDAHLGGFFFYIPKNE